MRALILSDIHGNLEALDAVLTAAPAHDVLWNLGDVVGYGASPNQVVEHMRLRADVNVRGNHDKVCCRIESADNFNPTAKIAAEWTRDTLTEDSASWLRQLPQGPLHPPGSCSTLAHGSPVGEDIYIVNIRDAWEPLQRLPYRTGFFGHTHIQGGFRSSGLTWHPVRPGHAATRSSRWTLKLEENTKYLLNPGSVGQPRDGDWRAAFALLDNENNQVTFFRVPYDITLAQGRILMEGLPERLAHRLRLGR